MKDERWEMRNVKLEMKDEKWKLTDDRWELNFKRRGKQIEHSKCTNSSPPYTVK